MVKNIFASLGILAVLLLSLGLTSADITDFDLEVTEGSTSNRLTGGNLTEHDFSVTLTNENSTLDPAHVRWRVGSSTAMDLPVDASFAYDTTSTHDVTGFKFTMPYSDSSYVYLFADIYEDDTYTTKLYTEQVSIYYNNTDYVESTEILGCTDDSYDNYDPDATTDDGTCANTSITSDTLCELEGFDEDGKLEITDFDVNNKGDGDDEEWEYLDQIEITVDVENTDNDEDIDDVEVMIVILDDKIESGVANDVTNDFDFDDEVLTDIGKLKDDEEDTVTFLIDELPSDLDDGTYYMYIMAYEDGNEAENCRSEIDSGDYYFEFTVESVDDDEAVIVKGSEFKNTIDTYCDQQNLEITVPVYNLGDDEEERVLVNLYDSELGIDEYIVIEDLDDGDKEIVTFFIDVPSDLVKEKYTLDVIVSFDWDDDDDDEDPLSYDEENSDASIRLNILGCKAAAPSITANLESIMEVGQELIVKTTITNNGDDDEFIIAPTGFDSWADLVSVTPGKVTIASGASQEVTIKLSPKQAGAQIFTIQTVVDGETYNQPVSVKVAEEPGIFGDIDMNNTTLYLIAGIAGLLILIFLIVIVRVARRPVKADF